MLSFPVFFHLYLDIFVFVFIDVWVLLIQHWTMQSKASKVTCFVEQDLLPVSVGVIFTTTKRVETNKSL